MIQPNTAVTGLLFPEDIAKDLGVSQAAIAQMEKVDSKPQKKTRMKYAAALGLTIDHLDA